MCDTGRRQGHKNEIVLPKPLHEIGGVPMLEHLLNAVGKTGVGKTVLVLGYGAEQVRKIVFRNAGAVIQTEQLGSGHAYNARGRHSRILTATYFFFIPIHMLTDETLKKLVAR
jgi:bifunctional UDP-N-acetylglucosamine pyrophosphorylase/glucosamine-1-phosphate N-acetyltransferase